MPGAKQVYGPGTLLNTFAIQLPQQALTDCENQAKAAQTKAKDDAKAAGKPQADQDAAGQQAFDAAAKACAQRYAELFPSIGRPYIDDPNFINSILLEPSGDKVRPFWTWALPDTGHALITVRLNRDASLSDIRDIVAAARQQAASDKQLNGLNVVVSGTPALTVSLADATLRALKILLAVALAAMLLVTLLVLRVPARLLAVPVAAIAGLWTAGAAALLQLPITPATLAVIPVVLGLATDYVIQAANRLAEEQGDAASSVAAVARAILPATGVAAAATAAGILGFALSPIPLVKQFAFFMAIGVAAAYAASIAVGLPAIALLHRLPGRLGRRFAAVRARPAPAWPVLGRLGRAPLAAIGVLALLGAAGWAAVPFLKLETDPVKLMPAGDPALADAEQVRKGVGFAGELDLVLAGPDTTSQAAVAWLDKVSKQAATVTGGELKPLNGLPNFLSSVNNGQLPDAALTARILQRSPAYFSNAVVSPDHTIARSVFAIGSLTSVEEDGKLIAKLESLPPPPAGFQAYPAGLTVIATDALKQLQQNDLKLNLAALALVMVVLAVAYRRPVPVLLAVAPTFVAAGWATGLIWLTGVRSSPITVLLAGVVVAFATEFSVLWLARYRAELAAGATADLAADTASRRVGPAVIASALALICGFLVLAVPFPTVAPVPMVQSFGLWCAADLALATAAVLVLLPPMAKNWLKG
jgi:hydrophobe/amphiphile efflux-3 (HAE3) family protein